MKYLIGSEYIQEIVPLINNAKCSVDVCVYQWGYYASAPGTNIQSLTYAIKSAIMRGVNVRVLLHCGGPVDKLRRLNAETANHLKSFGCDVRFFRSGKTLHAKFLIIDRTLLVMGSHNFSKMSMTSNIETSVLIEGSGEIRPMLDLFNLLFTNS